MDWIGSREIEDGIQLAKEEIHKTGCLCHFEHLTHYTPVDWYLLYILSIQPYLSPKRYTFMVIEYCVNPACILWITICNTLINRLFKIRTKVIGSYGIGKLLMQKSRGCFKIHVTKACTIGSQFEWSHLAMVHFYQVQDVQS